MGAPLKAAANSVPTVVDAGFGGLSSTVRAASGAFKCSHTYVKTSIEALAQVALWKQEQAVVKMQLAPAPTWFVSSLAWDEV